jgi:hypothetical protein
MIYKGVRKTGNVVSVISYPSVNPIERGHKEIRIEQLLREFEEIVDSISQKRGFPKRIIRSRFPCNILALFDARNLFILAEPFFGTPTIKYINRSEMQFSQVQALETTKEETGFTNYFFITYPAYLLERQKEERQKELKAIALNHINEELERALKSTILVQINPIFGPASFSEDEHLVFILMPFKDELNAVYNTIIKPTVESMGLACHRADDYKTNKAIIQDIWKSICEAKIVIADLTNLNPNVMYELGIAHTVGKETIMITQRGDKEFKFPFDISHIRRIEYENTAPGGKKLEYDLKDTIKSILQPAFVS